jgi:thioredoxin-related protein
VVGQKGTLVIFTCNACPYVKGWESRTVELGNAYAGKGIGVIAINANDPKVVADDGYDQMVGRAKERGIQYPYVVDATSEVARAFGATRTPEAFLFDAQGKLVYHGTIDDNVESPEKVSKTYLKDALEAVSAGKDVAVKETKAIGCGIKWRT